MTPWRIAPRQAASLPVPEIVPSVEISAPATLATAGQRLVVGVVLAGTILGALAAAVSPGALAAIPSVGISQSTPAQPDQGALRARSYGIPDRLVEELRVHEHSHASLDETIALTEEIYRKLPSDVREEVYEAINGTRDSLITDETTNEIFIQGSILGESWFGELRASVDEAVHQGTIDRSTGEQYNSFIAHLARLTPAHRQAMVQVYDTIHHRETGGDLARFQPTRPRSPHLASQATPERPEDVATITAEATAHGVSRELAARIVHDSGADALQSVLVVTHDAYETLPPAWRTVVSQATSDTSRNVITRTSMQDAWITGRLIQSNILVEASRQVRQAVTAGNVDGEAGRNAADYLDYARRLTSDQREAAIQVYHHIHGANQGPR